MSKTKRDKRMVLTSLPCSVLQAGEDVYQDVLRALRNAENVGGPDGVDYIRLMDRIEAEVVRRRDVLIACARSKNKG